MGLDKRDRNPQSAAGLSSWAAPLIVLIIAAALLLGGDGAREALRYERAAVAAGELWRLVSGHLVHLGGSHFALNAAGLALVWYLVGAAFSLRQWALVVLASLVAMDLGFWFLNPELAWYVGLSGLLHGLLAAGLVNGLRQPQIETVVVTGLVIAKLAFEQLSGPLPGSESTSGGAVIVDAHLYGAIGGTAGALLTRIRVRRAAAI